MYITYLALAMRSTEGRGGGPRGGRNKVQSPPRLTAAGQAILRSSYSAPATKRPLDRMMSAPGRMSIEDSCILPRSGFRSIPSVHATTRRQASQRTCALESHKVPRPCGAHPCRNGRDAKRKTRGRRRRRKRAAVAVVTRPARLPMCTDAKDCSNDAALCIFERKRRL